MSAASACSAAASTRCRKSWASRTSTRQRRPNWPKSWPSREWKRPQLRDGHDAPGISRRGQRILHDNRFPQMDAKKLEDELARAEKKRPTSRSTAAAHGQGRRQDSARRRKTNASSKSATWSSRPSTTRRILMEDLVVGGRFARRSRSASEGSRRRQSNPARPLRLERARITPRHRPSTASSTSAANCCPATRTTKSSASS